MPNHDRIAAIHQLLKKLNGLDPLKRLFWTELNYERINQPIPQRQWTENQRALLAEDPVLFAGTGDNQGFQIIYSRLTSDRLLLTPERTVVSKLQADHPYALFIFSNCNQDRWHFVNVKQEAQETARRREGDRRPPQRLRRITIGPEERLRTASERIAMLDVATIQAGRSDLSPLDIQARHDEAFDVEAVTKQFFDEYQDVFRSLQKDLHHQTGDNVWAHDYALQFLNRLMFLYFVQRKRWLGEDTEFLRAFWEAYQDAKQPRNSFFAEWLSVLFFEAFNNRFHGGHRQFPDNIREALQLAPYLNGGLFRENRLDTYPPKPFAISDARFKQAFDFLEQYNFTIAEDSPLDQEVAVDPEMIGKVYESLVNVSSEADERGDAGIFYTPRTEIDLMCRLALVDNLANHLGQQHKNRLYEVVFALEPDDKEDADSGIQKAGLWEALYHRLQQTTIVDPACGSGSFLVGMLHILDDLQARAQQRLGIHEDPYDRKKRIIGQSLYGVDVMEWACHVAELRLWLALIIDADIDTTAAHVRKEPLLPHFSFKIRCGDSLVQEVGGLNMAHIKGSNLVPQNIKRKITLHKLEKLRFYNNDEDREYETEEQVKQAELCLFREILDAQDQTLEQKIIAFRRQITGASTPTLDGSASVPKEQQARVAEWQQQVQELEAHRQRLTEAREALRTATDIPFVWDIAFVEVFEGDSDGFDIVVGNPPYVRQEKIADPHEREQDFAADDWRERKKLYKAKLARSVYQTYPQHFGDSGQIRKLDAKSDLYCYFYLHALSLLNPHGSFSFVTSNSWLDVGYGADLQEFLLRNCRIRLILDNQVRRTFADADVNTVIVLFSAPQWDERAVLDHTTRFVMFTVPFEQVVNAVIFEEIEEATQRRTRPDYRVLPIVQRRLLEAGCRLPEEDEGGVSPPGPALQEAGKKKQAGGKKRASGPLIRVPKYTGDKWGGKYLRAPDIYWRILEKGKDKLVRLGDIAEVRFGIKTGANEFFYFTHAQPAGRGLCRVVSEGGWEGEIEERFIAPVIRSPRECMALAIDPGNVPHRLFLCHEERSNLCGTASLEYIKWGEACRFHERPSCSSRPRWWDLGVRRTPTMISPSSVSSVPRTFLGCGVFADKRMYEIYPQPPVEVALAATNATLCSLFLELGSRTGLGEGLLDLTVYELADSLVVVDLPIAAVRAALKANEGRRWGTLHEEIRHPARQQLDAVVFEALGLSNQEQQAVYEAVVDLISSRMGRASSV